jgi:hypothetical protein
VIIALDTLCYESATPWADVGRLTAHELARYMGLYDNVDLDGHDDPISDDNQIPASQNLMFYSDSGGTELSTGQQDILSRSAVLR